MHIYQIFLANTENLFVIIKSGETRTMKLLQMHTSVAFQLNLCYFRDL